MIPKGLTDEHFRQAAAEIDRKGVPTGRNSIHYDLVVNGKRYPPKYMISLATRFATGKEYPAGSFNAVEARSYFLSKGYEIIDRRTEAQKIIQAEDDASNFPEGKKRFRLHLDRERDSSRTRKVKENRLAQTGKLECDACGLDFSHKYGPLGRGFIEAHHTTPVSMLGGKARTKAADIALVCSNCHRMLHRGEKLHTVAELIELININATT